MSNNNTPHYGKGIPITSGFDLGAKSPLDSRMVVANFEELQLHVDGNRAYEGMLVYVETDGKIYIYKNGSFQILEINSDNKIQSIQIQRRRIQEFGYIHLSRKNRVTHWCVNRCRRSFQSPPL